MSDQQMTPEEQGDAVRAFVLANAPVALDMWRLTLEQLDGYVAEAVRRGWPDILARQMVTAQYIAKLQG